MKKRQTELDILRFLATLAVIVIHMGRIPFVSDCWASGRLSMSIAPYVWCVPVFFMISGRFFLDPEKNIPLKVLFQKYIFRLILAFALWSAIYTAYDVWAGTYGNLNIFGILTEYLHGPTHFWYLYTAVALYLLTPFLRKVVSDKTVCIYALVLFAIYNITTQYLIYIPKVGGILESTVSRLGLESLSGYVGYFLLGYVLYVYQEKITKKWEVTIYFLGVLLLVLTYVLDISISDELRAADFVKQYQKPNVVFYSAALYLFFIKRVSKLTFSEKICTVFAKATEYGFGVYILHALVIELLSFLPYPAQPISPVVITPLLAVCVYLISFILTAMIRKLPIVGKYLL